MSGRTGVPDVSVVIPTRDREEMLVRAIASCTEATAGQLELEVIVVDDGSSSVAEHMVAQLGPQVVYLRHEKPLGRGRSRNDGLALASGRFVKFLDDDDWLEPGTLVEEVRLADASSADIVTAGYRNVRAGEPDRVFPSPSFAHGIDSLLRGESVPVAAALYRREALREVRWDESEHILDDWQFFLRAALAAKSIIRLDLVVFAWRSHPGQGVRSYSMLDNARAFYRILDELEASLEQKGEMTRGRRRRLAQYRYKELRVLCRFDRPAFDREVERIRRLDARFRPVDEERELSMRWLARIVGFRTAVLARTALSRGAKCADTRADSVARDGSAGENSRLGA